MSATERPTRWRVLEILNASGASAFARIFCCSLLLLLSCVMTYALLRFKVMRQMTPEMERSLERNDFLVSAPENESSCAGRKRDAFGSARLPRFERSGVIIPEWSDDTRQCDDLRPGKSRECLLSDGYAACFECVESRASLRVCAHVSDTVQIYDEISRSEITLEANTSPLLGYCLRENLAKQLRDLHDERDDNTIVQARRRCSVNNADWILVRKSATADAKDSSFNFVCKCKYPHLMANEAGPMSACSRAVGCNGHGALDEDSRESRVDPFVNGRCFCDEGWINEYDGSVGVGPLCREATVGEWPSLILRDPAKMLLSNELSTEFSLSQSSQSSSKTLSLQKSQPSRQQSSPKYRYLDLFQREIDEDFRHVLTQGRLDDANAPVELRDPCHPCPIVTTNDGKSYFCGDSLTLTKRPSDGLSVIETARIGVLGERDYLRGNGGRFPNACLVLAGEQIVPDNILVQFMSKEHSKNHFDMEIGIIVRDDVANDITNLGLWNSKRYNKFLHTLISPKFDTYGKYGVVWTFSHAMVSKHRAKVCESLRDFLGGWKHTDLVHDESNEYHTPYAFFIDNLAFSSYYYFPVGHTYVASVSHRIQNAYSCPDERGLDAWSPLVNRDGDVETDKETAHRIARGMLPVCLLDHRDSETGETYKRPEINCENANDSACVLFRNDHSVVTANQLWLPENMRMLQYCSERSGWEGVDKEAVATKKRKKDKTETAKL